jgi:hypothetical protein
MKKAYYYLFYKFYKFGEWSPSLFPSNSTAVLLIMSLELFLAVSLYNYYSILFDHNWFNEFFSFKYFAAIILIPLVNLYIFFRDDKWRSHIKEFDNFPREKNIRGTWIVIFIVFLIVVNLMFSMYLNHPATARL